jgi:hypothetical protein
MPDEAAMFSPIMIEREDDGLKIEGLRHGDSQKFECEDEKIIPSVNQRFFAMKVKKHSRV